MWLRLAHMFYSALEGPTLRCGNPACRSIVRDDIFLFDPREPPIEFDGEGSIVRCSCCWKVSRVLPRGRRALQHASGSEAVPLSGERRGQGVTRLSKRNPAKAGPFNTAVGGM